MKALAFLVTISTAVVVSGCVTTEQEAANTGAEVAANPSAKADAKPVAKIAPKARTPIRTQFIDI